MADLGTPSGTFAAHPAATVEIKTNWEDAWLPVSDPTHNAPHFRCDRVSFRVGPEIPTAAFSHRYGTGKPEENPAWEDFLRKDWVGRYVRVSGAGLPTWLGILTADADARAGALINSGGARVATGQQNFTAYGLELLLRVGDPPQTSFIDDGEPTPDVYEINRVIPFNDGSGRRGDKPYRANASPNADPNGIWMFARELDGTERRWTAKEAIRYLLEHHAPRNIAGDVKVPFKLVDNGCLDWPLGEVRYDGRLLDTINAIIDRRRGIGWYLDIDTAPTPDEMQIVCFSWTDTDIEEPAGTTILKANPSQHNLDFDLAFNVREATVTTNAIQRYDKVVVKGARRGSVCTLGLGDALEADWSSSEQLEYEAAASGETGYAALSSEEKAARNADWRATDKYRRVFSSFRIVDNWDGITDCGGPDLAWPPASPDRTVFPDLDANGDPTETSAQFWKDGLRIAKYIPLFQGVEYNLTIDPPAKPADFLPPIAVIKTHVAQSDDRFQHVERLDIAAETAFAGRSVRWTANVDVRDDAPAILIDVIGGQQHYIGGPQFAAIDVDDEVPQDQLLDYFDLKCTVYLLMDEHVEATYPAAPVSGDVARVLRLHDPNAHLDWMPEGTIVALENGLRMRSFADPQNGSDKGIWLRDDRERLKQLARIAWEWYGQLRKTLSLSYRSLTPVLKVGDFITSVGAAETAEVIRTVVTGIDYDLSSGHTKLQTQFANLDVLGLL